MIDINIIELIAKTAQLFADNPFAGLVAAAVAFAAFSAGANSVFSFLARVRGWVLAPVLRVLSVKLTDRYHVLVDGEGWGPWEYSEFAPRPGYEAQARAAAKNSAFLNGIAPEAVHGLGVVKSIRVVVSLWREQRFRRSLPHDVFVQVAPICGVI